MRLEGLLGYLRLLDAFLASLCVVLYVSIDVWPVHVLLCIVLNLLVGGEDTPLVVHVESPTSVLSEADCCQ